MLVEDDKNGRPPKATTSDFSPAFLPELDACHFHLDIGADIRLAEAFDGDGDGQRPVIFEFRDALGRVGNDDDVALLDGLAFEVNDRRAHLKAADDAPCEIAYRRAQRHHYVADDARAFVGFNAVHRHELHRLLEFGRTGAQRSFEPLLRRACVGRSGGAVSLIVDETRNQEDGGDGSYDEGQSIARAFLVNVLFRD